MKNCLKCGDEIPFSESKNRKYCLKCSPKKESQRISDSPQEVPEKNDQKKEKVKRESYSKICEMKQQTVLREQDYRCRGPGKRDNQYYECAMNVSNLRFSGSKSVIPQFDHIIRIADGGSNDIQNIQALCPNCHWMKTNYEKNPAMKCPRVDMILKSLTKPKYVIESDSSSDDEF